MSEQLSPRRHPIVWLIAFVLLCLAISPAFTQVTSSLDAKIQVAFSGYVLNRTTGTFDTRVTLTNISADTLQAPISLVVTGISSTSVTLANAAGTTADGKPYVVIPIPAAGFIPGASITTVTLKFKNTNPAIGFTFTHSVLGILPPIADAGKNLSGITGTPITLDGSASRDPQGKLLTYAWRIVQAPSNSKAALIRLTTPNPSFTPDLVGTYQFELIVSNGALSSQPARVLLTASTVDAAPIARAGRDQNARIGLRVNLDGSASSDPEGLPVSGTWFFVSVPAGSALVDSSINQRTSLKASFIPDVAGQYIVKLQVSDGILTTDDTIVILATPPNVPPNANAGLDQLVQLVPAVSLDGSKSNDPDQGPSALSYAWSFTSIPPGSNLTSASIIGANQALASFKPDKGGSYQLKLLVKDGEAGSEDAVVVMVNTPPRALNDTITVNKNAAIDVNVLSNDSDPDGDAMKITAVTQGGKGAVVINPGAQSLRYTPKTDLTGLDFFTYTISDGHLGNGTATVTVTIVAVNRVPIARAGNDQAVKVGALVTLDASASSDPDGDPLSFRWKLTTPAGSTAILSGLTTASPKFTADKPGIYVAEVAVNDKKASASASVKITASPTNQAPTVSIAGPSSVTLPATVSLLGTASDDGLPNPPGKLSYNWSKVSGPGPVTFTTPNAQNTNASFGMMGIYALRLTVNDSLLAASADITIDVKSETAANKAPTVNAGLDQTIALPAVASLIATVTDDGLPNPPATLSYSWSKVSGPGTVTFANRSAKATTATFTVTGIYVLRLSASDSALSAAATVTITVKPAVVNKAPVVNAGPSQAITLPSVATLTGSASDDGRPNPPKTITLSWSKVSGPGSVTFGDATKAVTFAAFTLPGSYILRLSANDGDLTAVSQTTVIVNPALVSAPDVVGQTQAAAAVAITAAKLTLGAITTASSSSIPSGSVIAQSPAAGASVAQGSAVSLVVSTGPSTTGLPPDPATVAPPTDRTQTTDVAAATAFLYTGANPIQTGVAAGTIEARRVAVLRGKVATRDGLPLPAVKISVLNHPELGQTLTRVDGAFDLAVNGGGQITLRYEKNGFLAAQRAIVAPWRDYAWLPDVVMIPFDTAVTPIDLTATSMQTARGSPVSDADGPRRATILFPPGTSATMVLPNGTTQPLTTLNVRATEYTVGVSGPKAMPAPLPPSSGYTYAVELSVDEAVAAGATEVRFNQALPVYVENFLGSPVGSAVPSGYYDRLKGQWIASANGRVIKVLSITGGLADLDTDGDNVSDDAAKLAALAVTAEEQARLAQLYTGGQTLWRMPITHFTPCDFNWRWAPPLDAVPPPGPNLNPLINAANEECGSIIGCENQSLGESLPVTGTSLALHYRSHRAPGRKDAYTLEIPLSGANIPASVLTMRAEVSIAGRLYQATFAPAPNLTYTVIWDGLDGYGRLLQGEQLATVQVHYDYVAQYYKSFPVTGRIEFGNVGGYQEVVFTARQPITLSKTWTEEVGAWDAARAGLGGWSPSVQHTYDPALRTLLLGDGRQRRAEAMTSIITTVAGGGFLGDGVPATDARLNRFFGVAVGPDGSLFIVDSSSNNSIRRVGPDGIITTVAGNGDGNGDGRALFSGDGGPAVAAALNFPNGVAVGPDGSVFIADVGNCRIRRVGLDSIITTVAGNGCGASSGDGALATTVTVNPSTVAVGPDGSLFIVDSFNSIRRVGLDGIITTVAGNGTGGFSGDGGPAVAAALNGPRGIAVGSDGSLYIADTGNARLRRVGSDGIITTVAGNGTGGFSGDGGPAVTAALNGPRGIAVGRDGSLIIADSQNNRLRRVGPDGIITTVAGNGTGDFSGDGGPAVTAALNFPNGVAVGPDGSLYIADTGNARLRRVGPALPDFALFDMLLASEDGREVYVFNIRGRHLKTLDALTDALRYQFGYDSAGYLTSITDGSGNVTTIERSGATPTAIVAPGGQRTALNVSADGWLLSATNPASEAHTMSYSADGLLQTFTDPRGNIHRFTYDPLGQLLKDEDPVGGSITLSRTQQSNGYTVTTTSALGRNRVYQVEQLPTGNVRRTVTAPSGAKTVTVIGADGSEQITFADGSVATIQYGPDPRFGMLAPIATSVILKTPGGRTRTIRTTRTVTLSNPNNLLSLAKLTDTVTDNGAVSTRVYDGTSRLFTNLTAAGRSSTMNLDALGRMTQAQALGLEPLSYTYDTRGLLSAMTEGSGAGSRNTILAYNAAHELTGLSDPLGRTLGMAYDNAGRLVTQTLPGARTVTFAYDAAGNTTAITPPGRTAHGFGYTPIDLTASYTPPDLGAGSTATQYSYNADRALTRETRPDGKLVDVNYDTAGRTSTLGIARGLVTYSYNATTSQLTGVTAPGGVGLSYSYDGGLLTGVAWSGPVTGATAYTYNNDLRVTAESVNAANSVSFAYDVDGLLTTAGSLALTHNTQNGLLTGSTLGGVTDTLTYNTFAELTNYNAGYTTTGIYSAAYTRDALARITQKVETVGGTAVTYNYSYDSAGRLSAVTKDANPLSTYSYDSNGNRTARTGMGGPVSASYDAQDRLARYGSTTYTYTANGELLSKTAGTQTTNYQYDALGNLLNVTLPNGTVIDYLIDGRNRRIGKKVNGALVQAFLYQGALRPVAELDGSNAIISRFVYATHINVPDYMVKGGVTYRFIHDQLGSPRLIVNTATGTVAQRIDYDEFGQVLSDTNPGFQPFGFAGGLYDIDTKLVRFGARDYDAETGRWRAKDPITFGGGNDNLYGYVDNDPVNWIDPSGTKIYGPPDVQNALKRLRQNKVLGPMIEALDGREFVIMARQEKGNSNAESLHIPHQPGAKCYSSIKYSLENSQRALAKFFKLKDTTLDNVLAHELGHIYYGHDTPTDKQSGEGSNAEAVRWENATRAPDAQRPKHD